MPGLKCDLLTFLREKEGRTVRSESSLYSKCSLPSICLLNTTRRVVKMQRSCEVLPESRTLDRLHWCHIKKKGGRPKKHEALNKPICHGTECKCQTNPLWHPPSWLRIRELPPQGNYSHLGHKSTQSITKYVRLSLDPHLEGCMRSRDLLLH